jgi:hypothetical protein
VVVAVVDSRSAKVYRYAEGHLAHVETLRASAHVQPSDHMGNAPKRGFHAGTRGTAATDAAQRTLRSGRLRMLRDLTKYLTKLADTDGWIVLGGTLTVAREAYRLLPKHAQDRTLVQLSLGLRASFDDIAAAAALGGSALRRASDDRAVGRLLGGSRSVARVATHVEAARAALQRGAVRRLFITPAFIAERLDDAEEMVRVALIDGAEIEVVAGAAAAQLDEDAGGVAASLRYAVKPALTG